MSILLVDDQPDNLVLLESILESAGYQNVVSALSAEEAYEQLGLAQGIGHPTHVDLILMDIMMPDISGIEACRTIKAQAVYRDIPIIIVTAKTDLETLKEAFDAGAMDYLYKPVRKMELRARAASALSLKKEIDRRKEREETLERQKKELEKALREIKVLRGLIPICASCKKIRDVKGYWQQLEAYFLEHSDVKCSHGLCDDCLKTHYSELENGT